MTSTFTFACGVRTSQWWFWDQDHTTHISQTNQAIRRKTQAISGSHVNHKENLNLDVFTQQMLQGLTKVAMGGFLFYFPWTCSESDAKSFFYGHPAIDTVCVGMDDSSLAGEGMEIGRVSFFSSHFSYHWTSLFIVLSTGWSLVMIRPGHGDVAVEFGVHWSGRTWCPRYSTWTMVVEHTSTSNLLSPDLPTARPPLLPAPLI